MAEVALLESVREVPQAEWDALVGEGSPFLEWAWLASLEDAGCVGKGTGWRPQPLVLREGGRLLGACPLYAKENSDGEFVYDWDWAGAAAQAGIPYYPKLLLGVPFTPVAGRRFLSAPDAARGWVIEQLIAGLMQDCAAGNFSGVHVNFSEFDEIAPLQEAGFHLRVGLQYHWQNEGYRDFDDYLSGFRSKRRNQIRRERRKLEEQGVRVECRVGDEITDSEFEVMFGFYLHTISRHLHGAPYLNREFFELLRRRFRERLCFVMAQRDGEVIGGALNVQKAGVLYGRYWGALESVRYLHFNVCYYAGIAHCIENGLQRFEPGAGGEFKQMRGFDAQPTWSLHYLRDARLSAGVARFLTHERVEAARVIEWYREKSALKRGCP